MEQQPPLYDLITPDGKILHLSRFNERKTIATLRIEGISPNFVGFQIEPEKVFFNLKSSLAQLGIDGHATECKLDAKHGTAELKVRLEAIGDIAVVLLNYLQEGAYIGKLFAADERRRVRDPEYLKRLFGRADRCGNPLLSLGGMEGSDDLVLEKQNEHIVAYLTLQDGVLEYEESIFGFLPTLAKALLQGIPTRHLLKLHQSWKPGKTRLVRPGELLLVRTQALKIRTVFGVVVSDLLAPGYHHTSARVLEPDRKASGDIYELFGSPIKELNDIPLEFYTLEPYREHVFFSDRDQLQEYIEKEEVFFRAFSTAPSPATHLSAVFIVKGSQMATLSEKDWVARQPRRLEFPGMAHNTRQALMVERYIMQQPQYPFLKAIEDDFITSQGILLSIYFPSPFTKRLLLSDQVQSCLKGIYFHRPSFSHGSFFSSEDRALLNDLTKFAIPVYWVDEISKKILQYVQRPDKDTGMFVPLDQVGNFLKATIFGVYGSNLLEGNFEEQLTDLFNHLLELREEMQHPLFHPDTPLALITGGGPGVMAVGNRVAQLLHILSCANIVDFSGKGGTVINEQRQNPYVEAKMTYRLDKLVERQAEFHLDFPIVLEGGIGTDFEMALEEVRRKIGTVPPFPILLFGEEGYWKEKITTRFQCNLRSGTLKGSEWVSNCFYCVKDAQQALQVYRRFFSNQLAIGPKGPIYEDGFCKPLEPVGKF